MKSIEYKILISILALILSIGSGIWLSKTGRPLNTVLFTLHKLISLASAVSVVITLYTLQKGIEYSLFPLILLILMVIILLSLLISGGFLSFEKPDHFVSHTIHRIMAVLIVISGILTVYLFTRGK